jgi:hypothetical protein
MLRLSARLTAAAAAVIAALAGSSAAAATSAEWPNVTVMRAVKQDTSAPLRDMRPQPRLGPVQKRAKKLRPLPLPANTSGPMAQDLTAQLGRLAPVPTTGGLNFAGVGEGDHNFSPNYAPPDTAGAVGKDHYVQWVNVDLAIFRKSDGERLLTIIGPIPGNLIWQGFGGGCEENNDGDVIVQYDKMADRWVLSQFSVSSTPYLECVAVSTSSDPTGSYHRYAFNYGDLDFVDYPKMGVWPDGYYVTYNVFTGGQVFGGAKVCAMDRAKMLEGKAATQQCVQLSNQFAGLLPVDLDGTTRPPRGSPNYLFSLATTTSLDMWRFKVDWANPANTKLTGPDKLDVPQFQLPCGGTFGGCVPQKGTAQTLDAIGDRLMYRAAYRNFGRRQSVVLNHTVQTDGRAAVRWYEIRNPGGSATLHQSGTFAPGNLHRWMGSIAMDKKGNIALGYSTSSASEFPSIAYTGRAAGDRNGRLRDEKVIRAGQGSQTGSLSRWGDYSMLTVDPVDDCTFWYTTEYLKANGSFNWSTRIASFKFDDCV